jgi:hypothetical protein
MHEGRELVRRLALAVAADWIHPHLAHLQAEKKAFRVSGFQGFRVSGFKVMVYFLGF